MFGNNVFQDSDDKALAVAISVESFQSMSVDNDNYKVYLAYLRSGGYSGIEEQFGTLDIVDSDEKTQQN